MQHYQTMLTRLNDFDTIRRWKDLTVENIYKWDAYLHKITKAAIGWTSKAGNQRKQSATAHNLS